MCTNFYLYWFRYKILFFDLSVSFSTLDLHCFAFIESLLIFQDFPGATTKSHDFPGLENEIIIFCYQTVKITVILFSLDHHLPWFFSISHSLNPSELPNSAYHFVYSICSTWTQFFWAQTQCFLCPPHQPVWLFLAWLSSDPPRSPRFLRLYFYFPGKYWLWIQAEIRKIHYIYYSFEKRLWLFTMVKNKSNCLTILWGMTKTLQPPTVSPLQVISLIDYRPP